MWRWQDNPDLNPSGIGSTRNLVENAEKQIRKFLRKKGEDDENIELAIQSYVYFFVLDKSYRKSVAKKYGKTTKELDALFESVLQHFSQYKGFAKLLKKY